MDDHLADARDRRSPTGHAGSDPLSRESIDQEELARLPLQPPDRKRILRGHAEMRSPLFSSTWRLFQDDEVIAEARRLVRRRYSEIRLDDGTLWFIAPVAWGTVVLLEGDKAIARAERRSFFGRRYDLTGAGYGYELFSTSRLGRRWAIGQADAPFVRIAGAPLSFNRMRIDADLPVPLEAVLLAWHVVVRAWEASAGAAMSGA